MQVLIAKNLVPNLAILALGSPICSAVLYVLATTFNWNVLTGVMKKFVPILFFLFSQWLWITKSWKVKINFSKTPIYIPNSPNPFVAKTHGSQLTALELLAKIESHC
jgi:hypothetical protein